MNHPLIKDVLLVGRKLQDKYEAEDFCIAGGFVLSLLLDTEISDVDFYLIKSRVTPLESIDINSRYSHLVEKMDCYLDEDVSLAMPIDIIRTPLLSPREVIESFDIDASMFAINSLGHLVTCDKTISVENLKLRRATMVNKTYGMVKRINKYQQKGFSVTIPPDFLL